MNLARRDAMFRSQNNSPLPKTVFYLKNESYANFLIGTCSRTYFNVSQSKANSLQTDTSWVLIYKISQIEYFRFLQKNHANTPPVFKCHYDILTVKLFRQCFKKQS